MFRVTYNSDISTAWRAKHMDGKPERRHIYRWADVWASLKFVEHRRIVQESKEGLVEVCTSSQAPIPFDVEDLWEEEVVVVSGPARIEYNGLLSLQGTPQELIQTMNQHHLPIVSLPVLPNSQISHSGPQKVQKTKFRSICLIED